MTLFATIYHNIQWRVVLLLVSISGSILFLMHILNVYTHIPDLFIALPLMLLLILLYKRTEHHYQAKGEGSIVMGAGVLLMALFAFSSISKLASLYFMPLGLILLIWGVKDILHKNSRIIR